LAKDRTAGLYSTVECITYSRLIAVDSVVRSFMYELFIAYA